MSDNWIIDTGTERLGPHSLEELRDMAVSGQLLPEHRLWKPGLPQPIAASEIGELFTQQKDLPTISPINQRSSRVPPPLPFPKKGAEADKSATLDTKPQVSEPEIVFQAATPLPLPFPSTQPSKTAMTKANELLKTVKAAGEWSIKQAERTTLLKVTLPAAYCSLGKCCYRSQEFRSEFADLYQKLDAVRDQIAALAKSSESEAMSKSWGDKTKATAAKAMQAAQSQKLKLKLTSLLGNLGKGIYDKHQETSGPEEFVRPIRETLARIASLDAEIAVLYVTNNGAWITPKRLVLACGLVAAVSVVVALTRTNIVANQIISLTSVNSDEQQAKTLKAMKETAKGTDEADDLGSPPPSNRSSASSGRPAYEMPPEIANQKRWPDLPLAQMPIRLAQEKKNANSAHNAFFSAKGRFVLLFYDEHRKQDVRIWSAATGDQYVAKSSDADYFSFPAAFSPDESGVACVDGEFLRIWNLKSTPATLVQSLKLPRTPSKYGSNVGWNGLLWTVDDVLVVCSRPNDHRDRSYQVCRRMGGQFQVSGSPLMSPNNRYKKESIGFGSIAVSPDGRYAAIAVDPQDRPERQLVVQITSLDTGKEITELQLRNARHSVLHFPSPIFADHTQDQGTWVDPGSCLEFSPNGQYLLIASQEEKDKRQNISVVRTGTWGKAIPLDCSDLQPDKDDRDAYKYGFRLCSFSPDGKRLVGISTKTTRTSRGESRGRVASVFNLDNGKRMASIDLGNEFAFDKDLHLRGSQRESHETVRYSKDGKELVVAVIGHSGWSKQNNRTETSWAVGSWDEKGTTRRFVISFTHPDRAGGLDLSPDGETLLAGGHAWDIPHLVKLRSNVDDGDKLWAADKHSEAFGYYCSVLADKMAWFVEGDLSRVCSRCVDTFAERKEIAKGRGLIVQAQQSKMPMAPETAQGEKLLDDFMSEQAEAKRREAQERNEAQVKRLAEVRSKNQGQYVPAGQMTKKQFVEKLKATMSHGRIDNLVVNAFFENYSFHDVFGEPESNIEWINLQRLISYRCRDGSIQLTVTFLNESRTLLQGINQY